MDNLCDLFNSKMKISEDIFKTGFNDLEKIHRKKYNHELKCGKCYDHIANTIAVVMEADIQNRYRPIYDKMLCDSCTNNIGEIFSGNKYIVDGCGNIYKAAVIFVN